APSSPRTCPTVRPKACATNSTPSARCACRVARPSRRPSSSRPTSAPRPARATCRPATTKLPGDAGPSLDQATLGRWQRWEMESLEALRPPLGRRATDRDPRHQAELARRRAQVLAEAREEGLTLGRTEGFEQGRGEGHAQGLEQGRAEGYAQGLEQGRAEGH